MRKSELLFTLIALVYGLAFLDLYIQWPGLFGENGVLPAIDYIDRVKDHFSQSSITQKILSFPSLALLHDTLGISIDGFCDFIILYGIINSAMAIFGFHHYFVFFGMWISYLSLFLIGQPFLSFQWDILLLEVGFLTFIVVFFRQSGTKHVHLDWCYRFLLWKLMFMAGVVKLQAHCPTWEKLTALEVCNSITFNFIQYNDISISLFHLLIYSTILLHNRYQHI